MEVHLTAALLTSLRLTLLDRCLVQKGHLVHHQNQLHAHGCQQSVGFPVQGGHFTAAEGEAPPCRFRLFGDPPPPPPLRLFRLCANMDECVRMRACTALVQVDGSVPWTTSDDEALIQALHVVEETRGHNLRERRELEANLQSLQRSQAKLARRVSGAVVKLQQLVMRTTLRYFCPDTSLQFLPSGVVHESPGANEQAAAERSPSSLSDTSSVAPTPSPTPASRLPAKDSKMRNLKRELDNMREIIYRVTDLSPLAAQAPVSLMSPIDKENINPFSTNSNNTKWVRPPAQPAANNLTLPPQSNEPEKTTKGSAHTWAASRRDEADTVLLRL